VSVVLPPLTPKNEKKKEKMEKIQKIDELSALFDHYPPNISLGTGPGEKKPIEKKLLNQKYSQPFLKPNTLSKNPQTCSKYFPKRDSLFFTSNSL